MAKEVIKAAKVTVGGVDLSDHVDQVEMDDSADEVETTSVATSGNRSFTHGLKTASMTLGVQNDHAIGSVADTLQPIYDTAGTTAVKVWPTKSGTIVYTLEPASIYNKPLWGGAPGDLAKVNVKFSAAGTIGITRGTA